MSLVYQECLWEAGIGESSGTVEDSYDNELAENVKGSDKNGLFCTRLWRDILEVKIAAFKWVRWPNTSRLRETLDTAHRLELKPITGTLHETSCNM